MHRSISINNVLRFEMQSSQPEKALRLLTGEVIGWRGTRVGMADESQGQGGWMICGCILSNFDGKVSIIDTWDYPFMRPKFDRPLTICGGNSASGRGVSAQLDSIDAWDRVKAQMPLV